MKQLSLFFILPFFSILFCCSSGERRNSEKSSDGLEIIKVDLSKAREGKLSEFFEPEIEYIWLRENTAEGMIGGGVPEIFFRDDKIFVISVYDCSCIQIFDKEGNYIRQVKSIGEGPGEYLEFNTVIFEKDEIVLLGVYPRKIMWFNMNGEFLREKKVDARIGDGEYLEKDGRYYFYTNVSEPNSFFVQSVDSSFGDSINAISYNPEKYYGNYGGRGSLKKTQGKVFLGMPFQDTIYQIERGKVGPKLVFDFGKFGQSQEEIKRINKESQGPELMDFFNNRAKLYFSTIWNITPNQLYSRFRYEKESFNVFYDRNKQASYVINVKLINDLDDGYRPHSFFYQFEDGKIGETIAGKELFKELQKKKEDLGDTGFEEYIKGKGKNFAQAAFAAKDSENPVLIVYTVR